MNSLEVSDTDARQEVAATSKQRLDGPNSGVTAGFVAWMCFLTFVGTLLVAYFGLKYLGSRHPGVLGTSEASQYVFVDEERLFILKLKESKERPGMSVEQAQHEADLFKRQMELEIARVANAGKTVLTKQAVLAGGTSMDVTDQVATAMGLKQ